MAGFRLQRLGQVMVPEVGNPLEVEGVLNPAVVRGRDGQLYLFPRLVAQGNYSRIGITRVKFDDAGDPVGVERLGVALEPEADYERMENGGGCEDPRITFVEPLQHYVMSYTALSAHGPRIALAVSEDLFTWRRLGLATFSPYNGIAFEGVDNKDAVLFPVMIPNPSAQPALAMLHRPLFPGTRPEELACLPTCRAMDIHQESIWISYCQTGALASRFEDHFHFGSHHRLAAPAAPWEQLKIGSGTPPVLTRHGWLVIYHGVSDVGADGHRLSYAAGVMVLSNEHPRTVRYRSPKPILTPELPTERMGIVEDVVFPTGIDRRDDLGTSDRFDVYYGMADDRIGVARLDLPDVLPSMEFADSCHPND